jgi:hypothetical protein
MLSNGDTWRTTNVRAVQDNAVGDDELERRSLLHNVDDIGIEMRDPENTTATVLSCDGYAIAVPIAESSKVDDSLFITQSGMRAEGANGSLPSSSCTVAEAKPAEANLYPTTPQRMSTASFPIGQHAAPSAPPMSYTAVAAAPRAIAVPMVPTTVQVILPAGAYPGQQIAVAHPHTGFQSIVAVPEGVGPGLVINVQLPSGSTQNPLQHHDVVQGMVCESKHSDEDVHDERQKPATKSTGYTPATYKSIYDTDRSRSSTGLDAKDSGYTPSEYKCSEYKSMCE